VGRSSDRSFEEFFAATYGRLVGLLFVVLHDRAQAEDVVQDAFASALLRWQRIRGYQDPEAWVRMVAFRRAVDGRRRSHRLAPTVSTWCGALGKLPLAHREVLVLCYVAELPVTEIAAELRLPVGTVKSRLARGRTALARQLRPHDDQAANRRRTGGEHPATNRQQPIRNDSKRQGQRHDRSIAAVHATAVHVSHGRGLPDLSAGCQQRSHVQPCVASPRLVSHPG
jgi:RNA polymerase sigma-70 factor (ECF subfamily)